MKQTKPSRFVMKETSMEKRFSLGVKMKKPIKRHKIRLLSEVVDYLKCDSYLFAPFIHSRSGSLASKLGFSTSAVGVVNDVKGRSDTILKKISNYLKSNSFMYAPLFVPQAVTSKGYPKYIKRLTMEVSTRKFTMKDNQSTVESSTLTIEDNLAEGSVPVRCISGQQKLVHNERMQHVVYQSCRSSSVSGEGTLRSELQKVLIDRFCGEGASLDAFCNQEFFSST